MSCGRPGCGCGTLYFAAYCPKCRFLAWLVRHLDFHEHVTLRAVKDEAEWVALFGNTAGPRFVGHEGVTLIGVRDVAPRVVRELVSIFHRRERPSPESVP